MCLDAFAVQYMFFFFVFLGVCVCFYYILLGFLFRLKRTPLV